MFKKFTPVKDREKLIQELIKYRNSPLLTDEKLDRDNIIDEALVFYRDMLLDYHDMLAEQFSFAEDFKKYKENLIKTYGEER